MYTVLYFFLLFYPVMIYPWGEDPYYTLPKFLYLVGFTLVLWVQFAVFAYAGKWTPDKFKRMDGFLLIFAGLVILSAVQSRYGSVVIIGAAYRLEGLISFISYISLYFFAKNLIVPDRLDKWLTGMTLMSAFVSIYGILQHFQLDFLVRNSTKMSWTRSYAFFDNPNFFGAYLVIMLLLAVTAYLSVSEDPTKRGLQIVYYLCGAVMFIALIYTQTRSAWLGFASGCMVITLFILRFRKRLLNRWLVMLGVFVSLYLLIGITGGGYLTRLGSILHEAHQITAGENGEKLGSGRWLIWRIALPLVGQYFWLGSGPDTFGHVFPQEQYALYYPGITVDKAHNEFLQLAVTVGVPCLVVYLLFLAGMLKRGTEAAAKSEGTRQIFLFGMLAVIAGYLVQANFNISTITVAPYVWVILGITGKLAEEVSS